MSIHELGEIIEMVDICCCNLFFFKQKTAYEMRISDWSSDVCSSDLGTSTPAGDLAETMAVKAALGDHAYRTMVSSTKSMTGHLLGAAGGVEAVFSAMALHTCVIPPTIKIGRAHV